MANRYRYPILLISIQGFNSISVLTFQSKNQRDNAYKQLISSRKINMKAGTGDQEFAMLDKIAIGYITHEHTFSTIERGTNADSTSK